MASPPGRPLSSRTRMDAGRGETAGARWRPSAEMALDSGVCSRGRGKPCTEGKAK